MSERRFGDRTAAQHLARAAHALRLAFATSFAALALFVLGSSVTVAWVKDRSRPHAPRAPRLEPAAASPAEALAPAPAAAAVPSASVEPPAPALPRQILIDLGPPRSEVFVDGRRVGQTPFLGQVKCRPGKEISIHVIPERGLPLAEQRVCPR